MWLLPEQIKHENLGLKCLYQKHLEHTLQFYLHLLIYRVSKMYCMSLQSEEFIYSLSLNL